MPGVLLHKILILLGHSISQGEKKLESSRLLQQTRTIDQTFICFPFFLSQDASATLLCTATVFCSWSEPVPVCH